MNRLQNFRLRHLLMITSVVSLFIGAFTILAMRVLLVDDKSTHYHANFALYINGQQDKFDNFTFYEEIAGCSLDEHNNPKHRVHMHEKKPGDVHVHADGVTWGHFFANIGYGLTNNVIKTDDGVYVDGQDGKKVSFLLNGQPVTSVANKLIESEDVLLIDYGDSQNVQSEYDKIPKNAAEYNSKPDPASCSGSESLKFGDRIKRALDFSN